MKLSPDQLARLSPAKRALLEKRISGALRTAPAPTLRRQHAQVAPLTRPQHGVWISEQSRGVGPLWNLSDAFRLRGALDEHCLRQAIAVSFQRHEVLRSQVTRGAEPALEVTDVTLPWALIEYSTALYRADSIERLAEHYAVLLAGIAAAPQQRISCLPLLSAAQRAVICQRFGAAAVTAYPQAQRCLHELFEAQVARVPQAIRIDVDDREVAAHVHAAHALLVELLQHEQASLVLAQRSNLTAIVLRAPQLSPCSRHHDGVAPRWDRAALAR